MKDSMENGVALFGKMYKLYFLLRQVTNKCINMRKKMYCAFLELEKLYAKVNRLELCNVLCKYGVKLLNVLRMVYAGNKACMSINGLFSECFNTERGDV